MIRGYIFLAYSRDWGDFTSGMNVASIGERLVRELPRNECRWTSNDRLQQGIFKKRVTLGKRVSTQVSLSEHEPLPPPMSWRVPLLPRLSPSNCSPNPTGEMVSDKEDDKGKESNSIDSLCGKAEKNIRTACRVPATSAHNDKEPHSNDDHACQDIYAGNELRSCSIIKSRSNRDQIEIKSRSNLAAPVEMCSGPDDADRDSSCKSTDSTSTRIEVLISALCEMQPAPPRSEGTAATSYTLPTISPAQGVSSQHANKYWTATMQQPDTVNLMARPHESNNRREEVLDMTDRQPHRLKDYSNLTNVDNIKSRCPSRVPAAPLSRVHLHRHRPLWLALRNRTLKITQEDPSIFSPSRENTTPASTDKGCWHIINRRIFGTHEVSCCEKRIQPEWVMFGGGIPALDNTNQDW